MPVGEESVGEYMDISLTTRVDPEAFSAKLRATMPPNFDVLDVTEVPVRCDSLMSMNEGGMYRLYLPHMTQSEIEAKLAEIMSSPEILIQRKGKTRTKKRTQGRRRGFQKRTKVMRTLDIRPMIRALTASAESGAVEATLVTVDGKPGKPKEVLALFTDEPHRAKIFKQDTLQAVSEGDWRSLSWDWSAPAIAK